MARHGAKGRGQGSAAGLGVAELSGATDQPLPSDRAVPGSERQEPSPPRGSRPTTSLIGGLAAGTADPGSGPRSRLLLGSYAPLEEDARASGVQQSSPSRAESHHERHQVVRAVEGPDEASGVGAALPWRRRGTALLHTATTGAPTTSPCRSRLPKRLRRHREGAGWRRRLHPETTATGWQDRRRRWRRHGRADPTRASRARVGPAQALGGRLRQGGRQGGSRRWRRLRGMVALGAARGQVRRAETDELAGPLSVRLSSQLFCRATAHPCGAIPRRRAAQRRCQAPARCRTSAVG
jgi:hypothetical protein